MSINPLSTQTSNFGNSVATDYNITGVTAQAGQVILAMYTVRTDQPQISSAPTWNGQTFSSWTSLSDTVKTVYIYRLLVTGGSATASVLCAPDSGSRAAAIVQVFGGSISATSTFYTAVSSFENGSTLPWVAPSNNISGISTNDLVIDVLFASNQDLNTDPLSGQVFNAGEGQESVNSVTAGITTHLGITSTSLKYGNSGTVNTKFSAQQRPIYTYVTLAIKGDSAGGVISNIGVAGVVTDGAASVAIASTNLGTVTSASLGRLSADSLSATSGNGTIHFPTLVDGAQFELFGKRIVTAGDGTNTAKYAVTFNPAAGWNYVTLYGTLNTTTTGVLNTFSPAAVAGDQIVFETSKGTVDGQGYPLSDYDGTQTMWHIQASTGTARSYSVVTVLSGAANATPSGVSLSLQAGTATAKGAANTSPSGVSLALQAGTPSSKGAAKATPAGVSFSLVVGTAIFSSIISSVSDSLPKFLKDAVKAFRKPFSKPFRKK